MHQVAKSINIDDAVLIKQCKLGESDAVERLIIKYQDRIYNVILKMCGNTDDAAELTQETFVKIIESIDKFRGQSGFYTWAFRIAFNITLNFCKRSAKIGFRSYEQAPDDKEEEKSKALKEFFTDDSSPDPATEAQSKELWEIAQKLLFELDETQRAVMVLRDIEGMDYAHIAEVLNVELGTVKSRLSRARKSLREKMEAMLE